MKQHVGRLADALDGDDNAARAQVRALDALKRPQKRRTDGHQYGNGDVCQKVAEHGKMYVLPSGRQWCPDQSHDAEAVARQKGKL